MTSRRDVIQNLFKTAAVVGSGGLVWGTVAENNSKAEIVLRPPGATEGDDFIAKCIKCGQCVEACPYDSLKLSDIGDKKVIGTPHFEPRNTPCYLCTNYPCTEACPSDALNVKLLVKDKDPDINNARMGLAVIHRETCIAYYGIQCDACYRACPLIDSAITLDKDKNEFTGRHANLKPIVHSDVCTGCGLCEHACVTEKAAIKVLPRELATGELGKHYIRSWEDGDELRLKDVNTTTISDDEDINSAMDYLNTEEELYD